MKTLLTVLAMVLLATVCYAEQLYNPYNNSWVTIPDGQSANYDIKYNPYRNDGNNFTVQPKGANIEFNPYSNKWDWDSGRGNSGSND